MCAKNPARPSSHIDKTDAYSAPLSAVGTLAIMQKSPARALKAYSQFVWHTYTTLTV